MSEEDSGSVSIYLGGRGRTVIVQVTRRSGGVFADVKAELEVESAMISMESLSRVIERAKGHEVRT